ncbi:MAG: family 43 glycosylhydrolase [Tannerellaceae bacterium]
MRKTLFLSMIICSLAGQNLSARSGIKAQINPSPATFCNPINLNYRFMIIPDGKGVREAADPVVTEFNGDYYLFASKSGGYWHTKDFNNWTFVPIKEPVLPIEDYAPATFIHEGYLYYAGSTHGYTMLYRSNDPKSGTWEPVKKIYTYWDPAFLIEGDNLYVYYGCSPTAPISVITIDLNKLETKAEAIDLFNSDKDNRGWERTGEFNELERRPYIEGAWVTPHNGKYYLQYAGPGTEWKTYADGVYIGDTPTGPFTYMNNSPVSFKPTGFIGGAGHGCLFAVDNELWKAATNAITVQHMFERRISLYPSGIDKDGLMYTNTYLGDYPCYLPGKEPKGKRPDWNVLSYKKPVQVSSVLESFDGSLAADEDARTHWVAQSADAGEWMQMDLLEPCSINAIQVNFGEYKSQLVGREQPSYQSYVLEASTDGNDWSVIADKSNNKADVPHDYIEFVKPFKARYIRLKNVAYTSAPYFAVRDLRVFGKGNGKAPQKVTTVQARRNEADGCKATVSWPSVAGAQGYIIRCGIAKDKLYNSIQVADTNTYNFTSLNAGVPYFFTVDAFNANGVTKGSAITAID